MPPNAGLEPLLLICYYDRGISKKNNSKYVRSLFVAYGSDKILENT